MQRNSVLIAGGGGFIGGHLVKHCLNLGYTNVRAVDIKPLSEWCQVHQGVENLSNISLALKDNCLIATEGMQHIYMLAADMGGMGFIENNKADCMRTVLINTHMLEACLINKPERYFYSSSACVYNADKQKDPNVTALKESDAYPAQAEAGYGEEKLFSESMCKFFREDYGIETRIARYHNVMGSHGTYDGGREKAPAAICRKVIEAKLSGKHEIEIWGDGNQTRSFTYIDDCLKGTQLLLEGDYVDPVNVGSSELVSINQLVDIVEEIAGIKLKRNYNLSAPKGVNGRNSDNTLIQSLFGWAPSIPLKDGLEITYKWIFDDICKRYVHEHCLPMSR